MRQQALLSINCWRFFDDATGKANIVLEPKVKLTRTAIDAQGDNFEQADKVHSAFNMTDFKAVPKEWRMFPKGICAVSASSTAAIGQFGSR